MDNDGGITDSGKFHEFTERDFYKDTIFLVLTGIIVDQKWLPELSVF